MKWEPERLLRLTIPQAELYYRTAQQTDARANLMLIDTILAAVAPTQSKGGVRILESVRKNLTEISEWPTRND